LGLALALAACAPAVARSETTPTAFAVETEAPSFTVQEGKASWYGPGFAGRRTANGEVFDPSQLTAAHRELPFDTLVRVHNLQNGRTVVARASPGRPCKAGRGIHRSRAPCPTAPRAPRAGRRRRPRRACLSPRASPTSSSRCSRCRRAWCA